MFASELFGSLAGGDAPYTPTPSVIVAEWAKVLSVRTTPLTGGHWQTVHDTCGKVLVGYVRVPKSLAEKAVALSGKRARFASIVSNKTIGEKIRWMRRDRIVAHEDYFRYCLSQAETNGTPLIFRQGGGRNLGLLGLDAEDEGPRCRVWILHGAPKAWAQEDVVAFLRENSWDSPQVITRRRSWTKGAPPEWLFKAFAPSTAPTDELFSYADESSYLTVAPEGPRPKKPVKTTPVSGLQKRWVAGPSQMQPCAPTQLDDDEYDDNLLDTSDEEPVESPSEVQSRRVVKQAKETASG